MAASGAVHFVQGSAMPAKENLGDLVGGKLLFGDQSVDQDTALTALGRIERLPVSGVSCRLTAAKGSRGMVEIVKVACEVMLAACGAGGYRHPEMDSLGIGLLGRKMQSRLVA